MNLNYQMQREDWLSCRKAFLENFDPTLAGSLVAKLRNSSVVPSGVALIGEGAHFRSYSMRMGREVFAIKVAKPAFLSLGDLAIREWRKALRHLQALELTLSPSFELLGGDEHVAMAMLFGDGGPKEVKEHWQPFAEVLARFNADLKAKDLVLDDYPQVRSRQGVPFICDLSDVRKIGVGSFL